MSKSEIFTPAETRRLSSYLCAWCDHGCDDISRCGAIHEECSRQTRIARARRILSSDNGADDAPLFTHTQEATT